WHAPLLGGGVRNDGNQGKNGQQRGNKQGWAQWHGLIPGSSAQDIGSSRRQMKGAAGGDQDVANSPPRPCPVAASMAPVRPARCKEISTWTSNRSNLLKRPWPAAPASRAPPSPLP